jgi:peroxiredoxin
MDRKIALIAFMVVATIALIWLSLSGPQTGSMPALPPADLSATPERPELPPGHPEVRGASHVAVVAPDFTVQDMEGRSLSLHQLKGKAVLLNFWSTTCFPCLMEIPSLAKLHQLMAGKPFQIMAITADSKESVSDFLKENPIDLPIFLDPDHQAHDQFGVYAFPESYIVGPDGKVANRVIGAADWSDSSVLAYFNQLLAPKSPQPPFAAAPVKPGHP